MQTQHKQQIKSLLGDYISQKGSQNKAATIIGCSAATLSQVMNDNWDLINDDMWRKIGAQIGWSSNEWNVVETRDFKMMRDLLTDAQRNSNVFAVIGSAGSGKSKAMKTYQEQNRRAYLISCSEFWNRKDFLTELLQSMGRDASGYKVSEMVKEVVRTLKAQDKPLIILDEADKLGDNVLYFFITIYNYLEEHCGIVLCATDHLNKRITRGVNLNKKGYNEIFSRIGRKFIELNGVGSTDVHQICQANGITDARIIKEIFQDCEFDLRRVKRKIHAIKMIQTQAKQN